MSEQARQTLAEAREATERADAAAAWLDPDKQKKRERLRRQVGRMLLTEDSQPHAHGYVAEHISDAVRQTDALTQASEALGELRSRVVPSHVKPFKSDMKFHEWNSDGNEFAFEVQAEAQKIYAACDDLNTANENLLTLLESERALLYLFAWHTEVVVRQNSAIVHMGDLENFVEGYGNTFKGGLRDNCEQKTAALKELRHWAGQADTQIRVAFVEHEASNEDTVWLSQAYQKTGEAARYLQENIEEVLALDDTSPLDKRTAALMLQNEDTSGQRLSPSGQRLSPKEIMERFGLPDISWDNNTAEQ